MKWEETGKPEGVSLCMIVKNEEVNPAGGIAAFLEHHLPMVDEVIVVDTGSEDRTMETASRFDKVIIYGYPWDGSFSKARNFSLDKANYDHILVLDADERLEMPAKPIRPEFPTEMNMLFGYEFTFINIEQDGTKRRITNHGDIDGYMHRVRYFMNLPCLRFRGTVHEQLHDVDDINLWSFEGGHRQLDITVSHYLPPEKELEAKKAFYNHLFHNTNSGQLLGQTITSRASGDIVSYANLEWEPKARRKGNDKKTFNYDQHLERLRQEGWQRGPYPQEAFGLLIDYLEGNLDKELQAVAEDMLSSDGEWFSLAVERKGNILHCYFDPENLHWDGNKYAVNGALRHSKEETVDVAGIQSGDWVDLNEFNPEFAELFYGRRFDDLPDFMKAGDDGALVFLPPENFVWPVGRSGFIHGFGVSSSNYTYAARASRGVRALGSSENK